MLRQITICACIVFFVLAHANALDWVQSNLCPGTGCLGGMNVTVSLNQIDSCNSVVTYTFAKRKCDISHAYFPVPAAGYVIPSNMISSSLGCGLSVSSFNKASQEAQNTCDEQATFLLSSDWEYMKIDFGGCPDVADVTMEFPSTGLDLQQLVVKGGTDCELCGVLAPVPLIDISCDDLAPCDDGDPCTTDTCVGTTGCNQICDFAEIIGCRKCNAEVDCADKIAAETNPCATWQCANDTGACVQVLTPGCLSCKDSDCVNPFGDSDKDCRKMRCGANNTCEVYVDDGCCYAQWDQLGCRTCVERVGCVFYIDSGNCSAPSDDLGFIPGGSSASSYLTYYSNSDDTLSWTTECYNKTWDGGYTADGGAGSDGENKSDGGDTTVAKGVGGALGGLAGVLAVVGVGAAVGVYIAQKIKERGIAKRLDMVGFNDSEKAFIMNNEAFEDGGLSGENPFFINRGEEGLNLVTSKGA